MIKEQNTHRLFGAVLLVSGCCIGAGMLGLPLVTISSGLLPSVVAFVLAWVFMAATGLLLLEANLWFSQGVNLMTLSEKLLGQKMRLVVGCLFTFLFYCLMVAYLIGGGAIISDFLFDYFQIAISSYLASIALAFCFGAAIFFGTKDVDFLNRILMMGLVISYIGLVAFGAPHVDQDQLKFSNWGYMLPALPAMVISFGFHNLVPSLVEYLDSNVKKLKIAILVGSGIPLLIYLVWDAVILGIVNHESGLQDAIESGSMITELLKEKAGVSTVLDLMQGFAFFALVTSFLAVAFSFVDFLADGLNIKKTKPGALFLIGLVLLPPLGIAYIYPTLFLRALNYAGAFGAVILFGMIPIAMVWNGRYLQKRKSNPLVPGGKISLLCLGAFALFIFLMQLKLELGV